MAAACPFYAKVKASSFVNLSTDRYNSPSKRYVFVFHGSSTIYFNNSNLYLYGVFAIFENLVKSLIFQCTDLSLGEDLYSSVTSGLLL